MKSHRLSCVTGVILLLAVLRPLYAQTDVPPPALDVLWQEAAVLESRQRPAEAADRYAAILAQVPDSQNAAFRLGYCLSKAGKLPEALAAYDKAVAANPTGYLAGAAVAEIGGSDHPGGKDAEGQAKLTLIEASFQPSP